MRLRPQSREASPIVIKKGENACYRGFVVEGSGHEKISNQCGLKVISKDLSPDPLIVFETKLEMGPQNSERPSGTQVKEYKVVSTMLNSVRLGQIIS